MKKILTVLLILLACGTAMADLDRCDVMLGLSQTSGDAGDSSSVKWNLDASYTCKAGSRGSFNATVDSDYSAGDTDFDLLKTWWRYIPQSERELKPLMLVSTEGTHDFDMSILKFGVGLRRDIPGGFAELSLGASRDIGTEDEWLMDLGLLLEFRRQFGKLGCSLRPQGAMTNSSEVRLRGGDFTYSADFNLTYPISREFSLGYHLLTTNATSHSTDQFLGLSYSFKK